MKLIPDNDGELLSLPLFLFFVGEDGAEEEKRMGREEGREVEVDCPLSRTAHKWSARFQDQTRAAEGGREGRGSKEERTGFLPHLSDIYLDRMGRTPTNDSEIKAIPGGHRRSICERVSHARMFVLRSMARGKRTDD